MRRIVAKDAPGIPIENNPDKIKEGDVVLFQALPNYYTRWEIVQRHSEGKYIGRYLGHYSILDVSQMLSIITGSDIASFQFER